MSTVEKRKLDGNGAEDGSQSPAHSPKKSKVDVEENSKAFKDFVIDELLQENPQNKVAFVRGHFEGNEDPAVVTVEKTPFTKDTLSKILGGESGTKVNLKNDIYSTFELLPPTDLSGLKASLIYPATEKHIAKYRSQELYLIEESGDDYKNTTLPYLETEKFSIQWVYNILEKKQEADRIVFEDPDPESGFILLPDMKWDRKQVENLYLVAIVQKHGIRSLRDLTTDHLPLLRNILNKGRVRGHTGPVPCPVQPAAYLPALPAVVLPPPRPLHSPPLRRPRAQCGARSPAHRRHR